MLCFPMLISSLPDANPLPPEHKIEVFVLFWPPEPTFSGISSTKSAFLCQNWQFSPGFCPFRAQNRGFCALFAFGTLVFGLFEHKIGIFVSEQAIFPWFLPLPEHKIGVFVRLFKEIWPLEAEKRANFCFCTLLSCYCLWGTAARAPGHLEPGHLGTGAPWHRETVKPWNRGTVAPGTVELPVVELPLLAESSIVMPTLA